MDLGNIASNAERFAKQTGGYTVRADGLAYCDTCGGPRQKFVELPGQGRRLVWKTCRCLEEKPQSGGSERAGLLQASGNVLPHCTFDLAQQSKPMDICRRYAARWEDAAKTGVGLLLWGDVGTGKTFAAHCVANELIRHDIPVFITSLSRVLNAGFDKSEALRRVRETPLVVFDDLGAERCSEYARETILLFVDERYYAKKPFIVTTNLSERELRNPPDLDRKRIYDRILGRCAPVHFAGASKRAAEAAEVRKFMQELLEG